jgi:flagellar biogenesis protein FliO
LTDGTSIADLIRVLLALAGVLVIAIVVLRYLLPRFGGVAAVPQGPFRLLARFPLEPKRSLYLVQVGKAYLVLSSSESGVQQIAKLDPSEMSEMAETPHSAQPVPFASLVKKLRP